MPATLTLSFDANATLFGATVRWETLGIAAAVLFALVVAAIRAGRTLNGREDGGRLRRDDLLLIVLGAIPGAVVGGRAGYVTLHFDYFSARPQSVFDPSVGGMSLTLAVVAGTIGGLAVARLLGAPIARWLHVAAVPLLLALGLGKLAMALGGSGQGVFGDSAIASRYVRPGPWGSGFADRPAAASQLLEGGLVLAVVLAILLVPFLARIRIRRMRRLIRPGWSPRREWRLLYGARRFFTAVMLWAVVRFVAATTWRDAKVLGELRAEQILLAALIVGCLAALVAGERGRLAHARTLPKALARGDETARSDLPEREPETRPVR